MSFKLTSVVLCFVVWCGQTLVERESVGPSLPPHWLDAPACLYERTCLLLAVKYSLGRQKISKYAIPDIGRHASSIDWCSPYFLWLPSTKRASQSSQGKVERTASSTRSALFCSRFRPLEHLLWFFSNKTARVFVLHVWCTLNEIRTGLSAAMSPDANRRTQFARS